jgi:hypothetical protein
MKLIKKLFKKKRKQDVNRLEVIVFTENKYEEKEYFDLILFMLQGKVAEVKSSYSGNSEIKTNKMRVRFIRKSENARGYRANYVLNLTQDKDFDSLIARPTKRMFCK